MCECGGGSWRACDRIGRLNYTSIWRRQPVAPQCNNAGLLAEDKPDTRASNSTHKNETPGLATRIIRAFVVFDNRLVFVCPSGLVVNSDAVYDRARAPSRNRFTLDLKTPQPRIQKSDIVLKLTYQERVRNVLIQLFLCKLLECEYSALVGFPRYI